MRGERWSEGARTRGAEKADSCGKAWACRCGVQQGVPCTVWANVLMQGAQVIPGHGSLGYATGWAVYRRGWCARQGKWDEVRDGIDWWHKVGLDRAKGKEADRRCRGGVVRNVCVYL